MTLNEAATLKALTGQLGPGETSVGVKIQVEHVAPTAVGNVVTAEATVEKINGRRITFTVSASGAMRTTFSRSSRPVKKATPTGGG